MIRDFTRGADTNHLAAIDASTRLAGDQAFKFLGTGGVTGAGGELRYQAGGTTTELYADTNGDKIADMQIQLSGNHALTTADLLL